MKVLLIGSGGREHALAWKLAQSSLLSELFAAPGNPGIAECATLVPLDTDDHAAVVAFCREQAIDLVVVGPEAPLVDGIADSLNEAGILVFGPSKAAARLEGSKGFTKDLCARHDIPTARYKRFSDLAAAKTYVDETGFPMVIKADGLAAGKGVTIATTKAEAEAAIEACFDGAFGGPGAELVIEEFLEGDEASLFCLCDGERAIVFGTAQDHKRAFDRDRGPNTGGMGAYSPALVMSDSLVDRTMREIIAPTLKGMADIGAPFRGVLYAGLMLTETGPKLIEYNVRFGDPETQVLMMRLQSDLLAVFLAAAKGDLSGAEVTWSRQRALTVVMASEGYPGPYKKGTEITALPDPADTGRVFHAGTRRDGDKLVAVGGRVLNVTATGSTVKDAAARAYAMVDQVGWDHGFFRSDIGHRAIMVEGA
ncbi:phosphoribosylamine--glycine ligase [Jiella sp. MQZ9-1]|uniref:Phosphoribosylamine--glycine ligase n=1 Tax=Jiella flava TaxID=2816857 RepID=A0A939FWD3_9HYPH|nr:phosphoribosylamine--glycine ligase [Jiella flava]MBO0661273.1 phosphoribosylamine--glycine ligase [Jiella flava]MCD2469918.1 phosphoribosylamine--glycine ligase [Jiella flava]